MSEEKTGLIYERMAKVFADAPIIGKGNTNREQGFKFRGIDDVYNDLRGVMARYQIFTTAEILSHERYEGKTAKGTAFVDAEIVIRWRFYTTDGSWVTSDSEGVGRDYADKYASKAHAISHKYALVQVFCIPTNDPDNDPDANTIPWAAQKVPPPDATQQAGKKFDHPSPKQKALIEQLIDNAVFTTEEKAKYTATLADTGRDWSGMITFLKGVIEQRNGGAA